MNENSIRIGVDRHLQSPGIVYLSQISYKVVIHIPLRLEDLIKADNK